MSALLTSSPHLINSVVHPFHSIPLRIRAECESGALLDGGRGREDRLALPTQSAARTLPQPPSLPRCPCCSLLSPRLNPASHLTSRRRSYIDKTLHSFCAPATRYQLVVLRTSTPADLLTTNEPQRPLSPAHLHAGHPGGKAASHIAAAGLHLCRMTDLCSASASFVGQCRQTPEPAHRSPHLDASVLIRHSTLLTTTQRCITSAWHLINALSRIAAVLFSTKRSCARRRARDQPVA